MTVAIIIVVGLLIGSFLNVCIYRMPKDESIFFGRSHCTECGEKINIYDLVPVVSYLILGGRCRKCKAKINLKYPMVEMLNAVLYFVLYSKYGLSLEFYAFCLITSIFVVIAYIDFEHQIIHDSVILLVLLVAGLYRILGAVFSKEMFFLYDGVIAGIASFITFWLLYRLSKGGMGGGDVKLIFPIGLLIGVFKISYLVLVSSIIASIYGIILMILRKADRKTPIPFGTFLAMGLYIVMVIM